MDTTELILAPLDSQDISQELILNRLENRAASTDQIQQKFESHRILLYGLESAEGQEPWTSLSTPSLEQLTQLITWASHQSQIIQDAIEEFLVEPTDEQLAICLTTLKRTRVTLHKSEVKVHKSGTALVLRYLKKPATWEQLLDLFIKEYPTTRRPAATLRQVLRRLNRDGRIVHIGDYYAITQVDPRDPTVSETRH